MGYKDGQRRQGRPQGRQGGRPQGRQGQQRQGGGQQKRGGFSTSEDYGGEFEPVAEGEHVVQVTAATLRVSPKSGNDVLSFRFELVDHSDDDCDRNLFEHATLHQRLGLARLQGVCLGIDPEMKGDDDDPENGINPWNQASIHNHLLGGYLVVTVGHKEETYQGKLRTREVMALDGYRPLTEEEWSRLEDTYGVDQGGGIVRDLPDDATHWKGTKNGGGRGRGAPPNDPNPPTEAYEDDIPY